MTQTRQLHGIAAIDAMFARSKAENRAAFLPYFCIGYPNFDESLRAIESVADLDVDGFEIGMPFSDPIADGPTIQAATQIALENGATVRLCLDAVQTLREKGLTQPMLMMGYANPLVAYGTDRFVRDARAAGADGLIVPDLPPEEAAMFAESCAREGLALVFFLAPTSNDERINLATAKATGFIYVVSLTGITGARKELPANLTDYIARLRAKNRHAPRPGLRRQHARPRPPAARLDRRLHRCLGSHPRLGTQLQRYVRPRQRNLRRNPGITHHRECISATEL